MRKGQKTKIPTLNKLKDEDLNHKDQREQQKANCERKYSSVRQQIATRTTMRPVMMEFLYTILTHRLNLLSLLVTLRSASKAFSLLSDFVSLRLFCEIVEWKQG